MLTIHFHNKPSYDSYILEYIWIDGRVCKNAGNRTFARFELLALLAPAQHL